MGRYTPPVPQSRYRLLFVPVLREKRETGRDSGVSLDGSEEESSSLLSPGSPSHSHDRELRLRGHLLRTARWCWCDLDTRDMIQRVYPLDYVYIPQ